MTNSTEVHPAPTEGQSALVDQLTKALYECLYQAEAHREFGDEPDFGKYFEAAAGDVHSALGHLLHGDDLEEVWNAAVRRARRRCGLLD